MSLNIALTCHQGTPKHLPTNSSCSQTTLGSALRAQVFRELTRLLVDELVSTTAKLHRAQHERRRALAKSKQACASALTHRTNQSGAADAAAFTSIVGGGEGQTSPANRSSKSSSPLLIEIIITASGGSTNFVRSINANKQRNSE